MLGLIRRDRAYVIFAIVSIALSVGATLSVFTVMNALWLRPLPFPDAHRLVMLVNDSTGPNESTAYGGLEAAEGWSAFEAVAGQVVMTDDFSGLTPRIAFQQAPRDVETLGVTSQYFRVLGLRQGIRGRDFAREDNTYAAEPVAIISHRLWSREFGGQADVIGSLAPARPFPIRIIGVAPPGFEGARRGERADVWIPSNLVPRVAPGGAGLAEDTVPGMVIGRLHVGQTAADAKRLMETAGVDQRSMEQLQVVPLADVFGTPAARTILIREQSAGRVVSGLAALVLLAGCTTLMSLVLVHYERRRRELAVRTALGASRGRLALALLQELLWVAGGGTVAAVLIAFWSLRSLPSLSLPGGVDLTRLDLSIDARVLAAGLCAAIVTVISAAVVPLTRFTGAHLALDLVASTATASRSSQRLRQALLILHVSATIVVLVSAGLFVRAVLHGLSGGPGYDVRRTAYVQVQVVQPFEDEEDRMTLIAGRTRRVEEALRALPGVERVALGPSPVGLGQASLVAVPKILETAAGQREMRVGIMPGNAELLAALGVIIIKGRGLQAADAGTQPVPAVVTASLARTLWPASEPLGQTVSLGRRQGTYTVVGIAPDFVYGSLTRPPVGVLVSVRPTFGMDPRFVVRTSRPELLLDSIRRAVAEAVPDAPKLVVETGRDIIARDLGRQRLGAWFFSGFGLVALVLGAGGVFGLVAYLAESRRREFGVRLALGATEGDLVWRAVNGGLWPVSIGSGIGLLLAAAVSRIFISVLPGVSTSDPVTYAGVATLMIGSAVLAGLAAAWRLRGMTPSESLRAE